MDLSQLQVFLTVAKEPTPAPRKSSSARSPRLASVITKLEESVGQPARARRAPNAKLTDAGELLRDYAERLLNLRDEIQKGLEDLGNLGAAGAAAGREP